MMFLKYKEKIESNCSIDFWADILSEEAIDLLEEFDENDWSELDKEAKKTIVNYQVRIAETLSEVVNTTGVSILLELLTSSKDPEVLEATIDSLNAIIQLEGDLIVTEKQYNIINDQTKKSGLINIPAKQLLKKLTRKRGRLG